tara:strand:+ start:122 stop:424 length:303 start_codon:yes stop_codon:yes gene_type:complete
MKEEIKQEERIKYPVGKEIAEKLFHKYRTEVIDSIDTILNKYSVEEIRSMWGVHFYNDEDTNHYGLENYHERKPYNVHTVPTEIDRLCGKWSELRDKKGA